VHGTAPWIGAFDELDSESASADRDEQDGLERRALFELADDATDC